jgi:hypothetical protein
LAAQEQDLQKQKEQQQQAATQAAAVDGATDKLNVLDIKVEDDFDIDDI